MSKFKEVLSFVLVAVMTAGVAIGGTMAYLQDSDSDVNVMTLGNVAIEQLEYERIVSADGTYEMVTSEKYGENYKIKEFEQAKPLYPATGSVTGWDTMVAFDQLGKGASGGQKVLAGLENVQDKFILVKNTGKSDAYVRTFIAFELGSVEADKWSDLVMTVTGDFWTWNWIGAVEIDNNNYYVVECIYDGSSTRHIGGILPAGEYTYNSLAQVYMTSAATNEDVEALDGNANGTYDILVLSQAIQAEGFKGAVSALTRTINPVTDASNALDTGFGDATVENIQGWFAGIKWPNLVPGVDADVMKSSARTLPDGTDVSKNVSKIVYGKTADYPDIVNGNFDYVENDGYVAYYVEDEGMYTVYMLSDGVIYAPIDSTGLFRDMTALTEVDLSNLDMSGVESAKYMFRECANLTTIGDVSNWDVSNLTSTRGMFYNCTKIDGLDVSDWDVSNIEDAGWMFYNCQNVSELDVADWDTSSFNFTKSMFYNNIKLTELDVENWDMSDVTDTSYMFSYCTTLGDVDLSKWDVSNVQYFNNMFKHARAMTTLDLSTWDTSSAVDMNHMFANCGKLVNLDISSFDTSKVTTMAWMFYEIEAETIYVGDKWSLESIANLDEGVYSHKIATASLVGGQGTTCRQIMELDSKCVAENGARINATARYMIPDGGTTNPGLLTYKNVN